MIKINLPFIRATVSVFFVPCCTVLLSFYLVLSYIFELNKINGCSCNRPKIMCHDGRCSWLDLNDIWPNTDASHTVCAALGPGLISCCDFQTSAGITVQLVNWVNISILNEWNEWKCGDLKCVQKPTSGRLSLTHLRKVMALFWNNLHNNISLCCFSISLSCFC